MLNKSLSANSFNTNFKSNLLGIWGLNLAVFMTSLDISIINTSLPYISQRLEAAFTISIWVVNSYQILMAAFILPLAVLADQIGYKKIFIGGLLVFTLASALCGFSQNIQQLIWSRAVQGLGAAAMLATNIALIRLLYPSEKLGFGLGVNAFLLAAGLVLGPIISSSILSYFSWSWIFLFNLPLGCIAFLLCLHISKDVPSSIKKINTLSIFLNILMFSSLIYVLADYSISISWSRVILPLMIGIISGYLLIRRDWLHPSPVFPVDLFNFPIFSLSLLTAFAAFITQGLALLALPFIFFAEGYSEKELALLIIAWPIMGACIAPLAGILSNKISSAYLCGVGLTLLSSSLGALAIYFDELNRFSIFCLLLLSGVGFGLFLSPNQRMLISSVPFNRSGISGGMLNATRIVGQAVGVSFVAISINFSSDSSSTMLGLGAIAAFVGAIASFMRVLVR